MKNENQKEEVNTANVNDADDSIVETMSVTDATNRLLDDKETTHLISLRADDLYDLSYENESSEEEKDVYGILLPEILPERIIYFKECRKSLEARKMFEAKIYSNELLHLMLKNYQILDCTLSVQNYTVSSSDQYYLHWASKFLEKCEEIMEPEVYNSIIFHLAKDSKKREGLLWMDMHEGHLDEFELKYPGFKSAYDTFINSGVEITYESGDKWYDDFTSPFRTNR